MRGCGLTGKLCQGKPIFGLTDDEAVMIDFDNSSYGNVLYWAKRTMKHHRLNGFIILKSSNDSYHVVFNRSVTWSENMRIVAWVSLLTHNKGTQTYHLMQCIKQSSTLRVSAKKQKPSPRIIYRYGKQDGQIRTFLDYRKLIKRILRKLETRQQTPQIPI